MYEFVKAMDLTKEYNLFKTALEEKGEWMMGVGKYTSSERKQRRKLQDTISNIKEHQKTLRKQWLDLDVKLTVLRHKLKKGEWTMKKVHIKTIKLNMKGMLPSR